MNEVTNLYYQIDPSEGKLAREDEKKKKIIRSIEKYWDNMITLEEFNKWYAKPEREGWKVLDNDKFKNDLEYEMFSDSEYFLKKNSPNNLSKKKKKKIEFPEILIPNNIPQKYMKVIHEIEYESKDFY